MLVEDEETLAMIIKDTLEGQSFIIHTAADGEEGLRPVSYTHLSRTQVHRPTLPYSSQC